MKDGIINTDTERGKEFGFTSDKFYGWLWKTGDYIWISFIESQHEGKGNFSKLMDTIIGKGFGIKVPTPFARMGVILKKKGFKKATEWDNDLDDNIDIWTKEKANP